jgi:hypothetical protein
MNTKISTKRKYTECQKSLTGTNLHNCLSPIGGLWLSHMGNKGKSEPGTPFRGGKCGCWVSCATSPCLSVRWKTVGQQCEACQLVAACAECVAKRRKCPALGCVPVCGSGPQPWHLLHSDAEQGNQIKTGLEGGAHTKSQCLIYHCHCKQILLNTANLINETLLIFSNYKGCFHFQSRMHFPHGGLRVADGSALHCACSSVAIAKFLHPAAGLMLRSRAHGGQLVCLVSAVALL